VQVPVQVQVLHLAGLGMVQVREPLPAVRAPVRPWQWSGLHWFSFYERYLKFQKSVFL
jgi:hypothetical protein